MENFSIRFFADFVGEDKQGNLYYQSRERDYLGQHKRKVVYAAGQSMGSIPPLYHGWLHHITDVFPCENTTYYSWQKLYEKDQHNFTDTYDPVIMKELKRTNKQYSSWSPVHNNDKR